VVNHTLTLSPCKTNSRKASMYITGKEKEKYKSYADIHDFDFIEDI